MRKRFYIISLIIAIVLAILLNNNINKLDSNSLLIGYILGIFITVSISVQLKLKVSSKELDKVMTAIDELVYWSCQGHNNPDVLESARVIENYLGVRK